ncbi:MAG: HEAT repeat domain-containing protein [Xanthomonadales bacterium]|jgi:hypothetical protein|nr:HEAT repeat domain-containing protein [Xanthomonadales bacterium]
MRVQTYALALSLAAGLAIAQSPGEASPPARAMDAQVQAEAARLHAAQAAADAGELKRLADLDAGRLSVLRSLSREPTEQEALAIAALEGLMAAPPERSLPLLKRVLSGPKSELVKARALFVLSQVDSPETETILLDVARKGPPALRGEAIRMIGISGRPAAVESLKSIYTAEPALRQDVIGALMIAGRKDVLLALAQRAEGDDLVALTQTLAASGAVEELRTLGKAGKGSAELARAYAIAGDLASLEALANSAEQPALRLEAIRSLGMIDRPEARAALVRLYRERRDAESREAALQGLMIAGDEAALLALYRDTEVPEDKRRVLQVLTLLGGDAAMKAIEAALQAEAP